MRKAICGVFINNKNILLVKKRDTWILPGGKPLENEDDFKCLQRECAEELSGVIIEKDIKFFDFFTGITPHKNDELCARVYFASLLGSPIASSEIGEIMWTDKPRQHNLSEITKKIIDALYLKGYLS